MPQTSLHIGFIGLAPMGGPLASNLHAAGYRVFIHNRSRRAVDELCAGGMPATRLNLELYQQPVAGGRGGLAHSALIKIPG